MVRTYSTIKQETYDDIPVLIFRICITGLPFVPAVLVLFPGKHTLKSRFVCRKCIRKYFGGKIYKKVRIVGFGWQKRWTGIKWIVNGQGNSFGQWLALGRLSCEQPPLQEARETSAFIWFECIALHPLKMFVSALEFIVNGFYTGFCFVLSNCFYPLHHKHYIFWVFCRCHPETSLKSPGNHFEIPHTSCMQPILMWRGSPQDSD